MDAKRFAELHDEYLTVVEPKSNYLYCQKYKLLMAREDICMEGPPCICDEYCEFAEPI